MVMSGILSAQHRLTQQDFKTDCELLYYVPNSCRGAVFERQHRIVALYRMFGQTLR